MVLVAEQTLVKPAHGMLDWDPASYDPTPGAHGTRVLSAADIQQISQALLLPVTAVERITIESASAKPPVGSDALRLFEGSETAHALDGMLTMRYANMSALDHVRAFVALIRTPTVRSTALATVARGAHESLARTWHLLARTSDQDFLYRTICVLRAELRYPEKYNEMMRTRAGMPVDPAEKRQELANELVRLDLPAPARIDLSTLVATMLDGAFEGGGGLDVYSTLSSVAHAHRYGVDTFVVTDEYGHITGLVAPRAVVVEAATMLMGALSVTGRSYVEFYGAEPRHVERLNAAVGRAYEALESIASSIWPDE